MRETGKDRVPGWSVRLKLTLSYAGFLMVAGALLLATVWVFLLRYVPEVINVPAHGAPGRAGGIFIPNQGDLERAFVPRAIQAMLFLLGFGLVGGWVLAGRMLAPLDRITKATRLVADGSLSHRIQMEGRSDEFRELADAFDAMLARIEADVAEQRRFVANASHELRTPLAITKTLLDVARRDANQDLAELTERLQVVNARAIELTEALLLLNRADQRAFDSEVVDLSLITEEAAETLLPLAEQRHVRIEISGDRAFTRGSPALLLQMVTNLAHNAIVHNRPDGGNVQIATTSDAGSAVLSVENTGEPVGPELISTLAEPFQRGSERILDDHAGVGLGLAIVKSIVEAHDGTIALDPGQSGGLRVTVRLPVAPNSADTSNSDEAHAVRVV